MSDQFNLQAQSLVADRLGLVTLGHYTHLSPTCPECPTLACSYFFLLSEGFRGGFKIIFERNNVRANGRRLWAVDYQRYYRWSCTSNGLFKNRLLKQKKWLAHLSNKFQSLNSCCSYRPPYYFAANKLDMRQNRNTKEKEGSACLLLRSAVHCNPISILNCRNIWHELACIPLLTSDNAESKNAHNCVLGLTKEEQAETWQLIHHYGAQRQLSHRKPPLLVEKMTDALYIQSQ